MREVIIKFPVKINKFAEHNNLKEDILTAIAEQKEVEHLVGETADIWRCDWEPSRYDWNRKWLSVMAEPLQQHLIEWCKHYGYHTFDITEIWFQQYTTGGRHGWHTHSSNFTNVYYVDLPEDSPKTQWIDPITKQHYEFDVKEGDIITFPSFLIHQAPKNLSCGVKTIISWNMNTSINDIYGE